MIVNRGKNYQTNTHSVDFWYEGELNFGYATGGKLDWDEGGKDKTDYSRPFISTIHGVRITRYGFVGMGTGVQYAYGKTNPDYEGSGRWNTVMIPLFLNFKGYFPVTEEFSPYVSLSFGRSFCVASSYDDHWEAKGRFYGEYGIGVNYGRFNFALGLQHQTFAFEDSYGKSSTLKGGIDSFFTKVGMKF